MIWFELEISEFLKQLGIVFEAIQWPGHLCLDPLIELLLLETVLDSFLLDKPLSDLKVALTLIQIAQLAAELLLLAHLHKT